MKNQPKRQREPFAIPLLVLVELFFFIAPGSVLVAKRLSSCSSSKLRVCKAFAMDMWNRIQVEKTVHKSVAQPCMMTMVLVLTGLTVTAWLTALEHTLQLKVANAEYWEAYGLPPPYNSTTLGKPTYGVGYRIDTMPGRPNPTQTSLSSNSRKEQNRATVPKSPSPPPHMVRSKANPFNSTVTTIDISVFQIIELVTTTIDQPSGLTSELPPSRPNPNDARYHSHQTHTTSVPPRPSETSSPINLISPQTTVASIDVMSFHQSYEQPVRTTTFHSEIGFILADPSPTPQQPDVSIAHPINQLLVEDISVTQFLGPMSAPLSAQTSQVVDHDSHRELFEGAQQEHSFLTLEHFHMSNSMVLNTRSAAGNNLVRGTLSTGRVPPRHTHTPALHSEIPEPSPAYQPRFQPLTPPIERSVQAEQPWSPEHPIITSTRQDKIKEAIDNYDALFQTCSKS